MYTLVTILGLASSYVLLRITDPVNLVSNVQGPKSVKTLDIGPWTNWGLFVLLNVIAVYTHFYAFFLVAFQFCYFIWWWWQQETNWHLFLTGVAAHLAIVAGYLPWTQFVVARYGADVSYYEGTLSVAEVVRKTLMMFTTGHSVLEVTAQPLAMGWLVLLLVGVLLSSRNSQFAIRNSQFAIRNSQIPGETWDLRPLLAPRLFLLLYLILPFVLLYLISYQRPKFHPRYLMLASPPFFLFIAAGLAALWAIRARSAGARRVLATLLAGGGLVFILATSLYADVNAFSDPAFTKDQFREAARHITTNKQTNEPVILISGHLFPVFTYYYHNSDWFPIPNEPTLSTRRVVTYAVADDLNRVVAGQRGLWLVLWQDDVVDPTGILLSLLDDAAPRAPDSTSFWGVRVLHYKFPDGVTFSRQPKIQNRLAVNFENKLQLLGYDVPEPAPADKGLTLTLYWKALQALKDDYSLALRVRDSEGHLWGKADQRPTAYAFPTTRWPAGEIFFGQVRVPLEPGTPAGTYQVEVTVYSANAKDGLDVLDSAGAPAGKRAALGEARLAPATRPPTEAELNLKHPLRADFGGLELIGYDLSRDQVKAGEKVEVTLFWRARSRLTADLDAVLQITDEKGQAFLINLFPIGTTAFPTSRWSPGEIVRGQYTLFAPALVPSPSAQVRLRVLRAGQSVGPLLVVAALTLEASEHRFAPPTVVYTNGSRIGQVATLYGYDLRLLFVPGETLRVTLHWRALQTTSIPYTVFVHLLDQNQRVVAQSDQMPGAGTRPTTGWVPNEYIADVYDLPIKRDTLPGDYRLEIGMYDARTGERVPVTGPDGKVVPGSEMRILLPQTITIR